MAVVARLSSSLYSLSSHLLHTSCSPVASWKSSCRPSNCRSRTSNLSATDPRTNFLPAIGSLGVFTGTGDPVKKVWRRSAGGVIYPSNPGRCVKLGSGVYTTACVALHTRAESKNSRVGHDNSALTPLCERSASCISSFADLCKWRNEAQKLAMSVGSEYLDADGGPEVTDLLRELEWLLDDTVAACCVCFDDLNIPSNSWKACSWRDVKDLQPSTFRGDSLLETSVMRTDLTTSAEEAPAIYGSFRNLCEERHSDPVNEFALDGGLSFDGIRESLEEMAQIDDHSPDSEGRVSSAAVLLSGLNKQEVESARGPSHGSLRTSNLRLLLRISIEELDKLWKERIGKRRPFQYVVAAAHWRDFILGVTEGVLIPRPETEQIVDLAEMAISRNKILGEGLWADLGTGSGAIAIALARMLQPPGSVLAVDASSAAVSVASRNVNRYGLQNKVKVQQGLWFSPWLSISGELAGVISNPPYIPSGELAALQAEVGQHEPRIALDGGPDGMTDLREICGGSATALQSGGFLALETNGGEQAHVLVDLLSEMRVLGTTGVSQLCFRDVKIVKDFAGIDRFVTATRC